MNIYAISDIQLSKEPLLIQLETRADWAVDLEVVEAPEVEETLEDVELHKRLECEVERDQMFVGNLNYFASKTSSKVQTESVTMVEDNSEPTPKGFLAFLRDGIKVYFKKASILWTLSAEGSKVSTDRIHRFEGTEKQFNPGDKILLGDFLKMKFQRSARVVQVLGFKFANGKTFHGDHYLFNRAKDNSSAVVLFCNFFEEKGDDLIPTKCLQRYIKVENYIKHLHPKLQWQSGTLKM